MNIDSRGWGYVAPLLPLSQCLACCKLHTVEPFSVVDTIGTTHLFFVERCPYSECVVLSHGPTHWVEPMLTVSALYVLYQKTMSESGSSLYCSSPYNVAAHNVHSMSKLSCGM